MLLQNSIPRETACETASQQVCRSHPQFAPVVGSLSPHRVRYTDVSTGYTGWLRGIPILDKFSMNWVVQSHRHQTTRVLNTTLASWARNDDSAALQATTTVGRTRPAKEWSLSTAMAESPSPHFPPRYVLLQKGARTLGGEKKTVQKLELSSRRIT